MLCCSRPSSEVQGDREGDEINVGDVCVELGFVVCEFAEIPGFEVVGIAGVTDAGLDESCTGLAWVEEEGKGVVHAEPDAAAGDVGDCDRPGGVRRSEGNATVGREGRAS